MKGLEALDPRGKGAKATPAWVTRDFASLQHDVELWEPENDTPCWQKMSKEILAAKNPADVRRLSYQEMKRQGIAEDKISREEIAFLRREAMRAREVGEESDGRALDLIASSFEKKLNQMEASHQGGQEQKQQQQPQEVSKVRPADLGLDKERLGDWWALTLMEEVHHSRMDKVKQHAQDAAESGAVVSLARAHVSESASQVIRTNAIKALRKIVEVFGESNNLEERRNEASSEPVLEALQKALLYGTESEQADAATICKIVSTGNEKEAMGKIVPGLGKALKNGMELSQREAALALKNIAIASNSDSDDGLEQRRSSILNCSGVAEAMVNACKSSNTPVSNAAASSLKILTEQAATTSMYVEKRRDRVVEGGGLAALAQSCCQGCRNASGAIRNLTAGPDYINADERRDAIVDSGIPTALTEVLNSVSRNGAAGTMDAAQAISNLLRAGSRPQALQSRRKSLEKAGVQNALQKACDRTDLLKEDAVQKCMEAHAALKQDDKETGKAETNADRKRGRDGFSVKSPSLANRERDMDYQGPVKRVRVPADLNQQRESSPGLPSPRSPRESEKSGKSAEQDKGRLRSRSRGDKTEHPRSESRGEERGKERGERASQERQQRQRPPSSRSPDKRSPPEGSGRRRRCERHPSLGLERSHYRSSRESARSRSRSRGSSRERERPSDWRDDRSRERRRDSEETFHRRRSR